MDLAYIVKQGIIAHFLLLRDLINLRLVNHAFLSCLNDNLIRLNICQEDLYTTRDSPTVLPANVGKLFPCLQSLHFHHRSDVPIKWICPQSINELRNLQELHIHGFSIEAFALQGISDNVYGGLKKLVLNSMTNQLQQYVTEQDAVTLNEDIGFDSTSMANAIYKLSSSRLVLLNLQGSNVLDDNLVHSICKYFVSLEDLCVAHCRGISTPRLLFASPVLSKLDLSNCFKLKFLDFGTPEKASHVKNLNLSGCFNLKEFPEIDCNFEEIRLLGCFMLERFTICSNTIKYIDVRNCVNLASVKIISQSLEEIQISVCPSLDSVFIQGNSLHCLDLALSKSLKLFYLESTSIQDLSLCGCSSLKSLQLSCPNLRPEKLLLYGTSYFRSSMGIELIDA